MPSDVLIPVSWRAKPRSFVALMSVYESNYIRLRALVGAPGVLRATRRSRVAGDCELVLELLEQTRYTTTLLLTYLLPRVATAAVLDRYPDLRVRVYNDARLAEALSQAAERAAVTHPVLGALRRSAERELDQRWALNMMLNKWLEYCLERGHRFD